MAKFSANTLLIKVLSGGSYVLAGASTEDNLTWNDEPVDVTNKTSNRWRELEANGLRSASLSMSAFADDSTGFAELEAAHENSTQVRVQFEWFSDQLLIGDFHIPSFEYTGTKNEMQTASISFESADWPIYGAPADFLLDENDDNLLDENLEYLQ